ncbi:hypothetical protein PORY_002122 [Pneumocystis oryctolagi]|uniref:Uncharacterized protein n=1 Tax=Pneumocystis oryctolagi TaxID=42067 RepID=A0ACB7C9M4_9ASCO|nr:hypothetical protein PORY_002122 [Pneumocystis oryctolagi]
MTEDTEQSTSNISSDISDSLSIISSDTDREWQESLNQLNILLYWVLIPFVGKWVGRRFAYFLWKQHIKMENPIESAVKRRNVFGIANMLGLMPLY